MMTTTNKRDGSVLLIALILAFAVGIVVASVHQLTVHEYRLSHRSASYAKALDAAEAGVDLACVSFYKTLNTEGDAWTGWELQGTNWIRNWDSLTPSATPSLSSEFYVIANTNNWTITSKGRVSTPTFSTPIERTVRVVIEPFKFSPFVAGMISKDLIEISGQTYMDSFNSEDPAKSTNGQYDEAKAGDDLTVISLSHEEPTFKGSDGKICGDAAVGGPDSNGFDLSGLVITKALKYNAEGDVADVEVPISTAGNGSPIESATTIWVAGTKDMSIEKISLGDSDHLTITGEGRLRMYIKDDVSIGGQIRLIPTGAANLSVEFYCNKTVNISGVGIVNGTGLAKNFSIWGTENCKDVNYSGQSDYLGTLYTPYAELKVSGQGGITGAVVAGKITYSGQGDFHFDRALLGGASSSELFKFISWIEL